MALTIRLEQEQDRGTVEALTREAFWNLYVPGASEHLVLHNLRGSDGFIHDLDFVAELDGMLVGNIVYTRSNILDASGRRHGVATFGPVSVLPVWQNRGIGSALIRHSLAAAAALGHTAVVIYGHPEYYGRFGFVGGKQYGIAASDGRYMKALLAKELHNGALQDVSGRFIEDPAFAVTESALEAFDAQFPHKEKAETDSQKAFAILASALA